MSRCFLRAATAALLVPVVFVLAACGGGSGGDTPTHEFALSLGGSGANGRMTFANGEQPIRTRDIVAVDLAAPDKGVVTVETAAFSNPSVMLPRVVEYQHANDVVKDMRTRYVIYFKGGKLYRLDTRVSGDGVPVPRQLSALQSSEVCAKSGAVDLGQVYGDPASADRSWLFIPAPGADGACDTADDGSRAVRLDMDATAVPPAVGKPLVPLYENGTFTFQGIVVQAGNEVQRLDAEMKTATHLFDVDASVLHNVEPLGFERPGMWLFQEGQTLWGVDLSAPTARTPVATLDAGEIVATEGWSLSTATYVQIDTATSSRIVRIDPAWNLTTVVSSASLVTEFLTTPTRIVWVNAEGIGAAPLAGGAPVVVVAAGPGEFIPFVQNIGDSLWTYRRYADPLDGTKTLVDTLVFSETGTTLATFPRTAILAFLSPPSWTLSERSLVGWTVVVAEGITSDRDFHGASLRAYRGADRTLATIYGNVPSDQSGQFISAGEPIAYGRAGLFLAYDFRVTGPNISDAIDLYFFDSDAPGLTRLTRNLPLTGSSAPGLAASPAPRGPSAGARGARNR